MALTGQAQASSGFFEIIARFAGRVESGVGMKDNMFSATSYDDSFERPCFTFGYNQAIGMARALGHKYIAKVKILPGGAFEYYDADGI